MRVIKVPEPTILVLAEGESPQEIANAKGHLFEEFVAIVLSKYGYNRPTRERLNVTADGIELDISARHKLTQREAIAECKAYSVPVAAGLVSSFYGRLSVRRYQDSQLHGYFVALPRLTADGKQLADTILESDPNFTLLTAEGVLEAVRDQDLVRNQPVEVELVSDQAVLITQHGLYSACIELDPMLRTSARVLVWSRKGVVPQPVVDLIANSTFAPGVPIIDLGVSETTEPSPAPEAPAEQEVIVPVAGSSSDFEYQLPASPKFFVGRKQVLSALAAAVAADKPSVVLNAQSGWGKSSVALRFKRLVDESGGRALVVDSRTAASRRYVSSVLRSAALAAAEAGLLVLPSNSSWASLPSSLATLAAAEWRRPHPLVIFFDQFENVFRDESLTREFRDLALGSRELAGRLVIGFAWKTDLVGWTESHPYQLRDEIRSGAVVLTLGPLGAAEVELLLRRLQREMGRPLLSDLRRRLREYSQGLPWLFKKLAGHVLREVTNGVTQEKLLSEALNVQNLFDADLSELGPADQEALRHIARYAPLAVSEVLDRFPAPIINSLLDRRLVVQVGERLDTYWDIFRDYLTTGTVPIQDSYIIRMGPVSVARLLRRLADRGGAEAVPELAQLMGTSENAVFNLGRELRLLGVAGYEPNRVQLVPEVWGAQDREEAFRERITASLRRHRAYSTFVALAERSGGQVAVAAFARELPTVFPSVEVRDTTWVSYARTFLLWFEYAGLAIQGSGGWSIAPETAEGIGELLGPRLPRRVKKAFPHVPPGPSIQLLSRLAKLPDQTIISPLSDSDRSAARPLVVLGALEQLAAGGFRLRRPDLVDGTGAVVPNTLRGLIASVPGGSDALDLLVADPTTPAALVGGILKDSLEADWEPGTTSLVGKYFRAWARTAGLPVVRRRVSTDRAVISIQPKLPILTELFLSEPDPNAAR